MDIADKLEQYCDYGNPPGLNALLCQAAQLLRDSRPIIDIDDDEEEEDNNNNNESRNKYELH